MKKLIYAVLAALAIVISVIAICNMMDKPDEVQTEEVLPKTNAERYPERYVGVEAGCAQIYDDSYYSYLVSLEGKYPHEADLFDMGSPLRVALVNMLGIEKFAILNTFFLLEDHIAVKDNWVVLKYMWPHLAYRSVTIFIDTQNRLMYVQWVNPDELELFLFYELARGEQASPATILGREIPESMRDGICYGLLPDFDPDQTTDNGQTL